jgi:hypothetical protein
LNIFLLIQRLSERTPRQQAHKRTREPSLRQKSRRIFNEDSSGNRRAWQCTQIYSDWRWMFRSSASRGSYRRF